jgi:hypothetical protein
VSATLGKRLSASERAGEDSGPAITEGDIAILQFLLAAQKVSNLEVLRILLSIGPTETSHFQTWHD